MTYLSEVESALANAHREERHLREVNTYLDGELKDAKAKIAELEDQCQRLRSHLNKRGPETSGIQTGGEVAS